ncbi:MAG: DNA polymerase III subunit [Planctomycetia bacterium]|nr:DNA polymerase III subunit [Planctomycetia bacterium]
MAWDTIQGHDQNVEIFRRALIRNRLASTFLFAGPPGIGKKLFAQKLAQTLLCGVNPPEKMTPCGTCNDCRLALTGSHPDIHYIQKPEDRAFIPLELLTGSKENRQSGLCAEISMTPFHGKRKIAIIDDADYLNLEGANALLKTLEEPPENAVIILIGTSVSRQLPTIRSRCQIIRFSPLPPDILEELFLKKLAEESPLKGAAKEKKQALLPQQISEIIHSADGSLHKALEMADPVFWEFRKSFLEQLAEKDVDRFILAAEIEKLLNAGSKKVPALQRNRIRLIMECTANFYARLARFLSGSTTFSDFPETQNSEALHSQKKLMEKAAKNWNHGPEMAAVAATRTLDKIELLQRNVHQQTLLEAWLDELILIREDGFCKFPE